jgi:hypothetical protein
MNYIVEDDFDFFSELKAETKTVATEDGNSLICMISHEPLTYNAITLSCKHSFNYLPLFKELSLYNNSKSIFCPYCRTKADKLIPYIPLPTVTKINGVNSPSKYCMPGPKCAFLIKKQAKCNHSGVEYAHGTFCEKHINPIVEDVWSQEKQIMFKSKNVPELKELLRAKGLKVGGLKKELINRLFA